MKGFSLVSKLFVFLVALLSPFLLPLSPVLATTPRDFYDWSATKELSGTEVRVLGAQSPAADGLLKFNKYFLVGSQGADSPLHFLKVIEENIQLTFTFDDQEKDEMRLAIAGERLVEIKNLADRGKTSGISGAVSNYGDHMNNVVRDLEKWKKDGRQIDNIFNVAEEETAKHGVVLEQVAIKVPEVGRGAVQRAIGVSTVGADMVADLSGRPAVPPDLVDRVTALKSQGLITSEEANKLVGAKSRAEARAEFQKYVNEGIMPAADLLRMNEMAKNLYPTEFYAIHEAKRFFELKKLETEKPSDQVLARVQEFAKTYRPGEIVPSDLRKYWAPIVRKEEIDNTIRPDYLSADLFKYNPDDEKKFNEIVERYKPRPEDIAFLENYIRRNPSAAAAGSLPPEYERMRGVAERFGAVCSSGNRWQMSETGGGACVPENSEIKEIPRVEVYAKGKSCVGAIVSVKGPSGECSAYPSDCLPQGWSRVNSCGEANNPQSGLGREPGQSPISCPSNAHFVAVYSQGSGYCVPNYTPRGGEESYCPGGYHRSYQGGPCLADSPAGAVVGISLPSLTTTPGNYPNPFYPASSSCGKDSNWVPEPINPRGGYCTPKNYQPPFVGSGQTISFPPNPEMGNCTTPSSCYDWCKANAGKCQGFNVNSPRPSDNAAGGGYAGSREGQEATCRAGGGTCDWTSGVCSCRGYQGSGGQTDGSSGCKPAPECVYRTPYCYMPVPDGGWCPMPTGGYSGGGGTSPSRESQEAACRSGGGVCVSWVNGACGCERNGGIRDGSSYPSACAYPPGGCGSGNYWDSGSCSCRANGTSSGGNYDWDGMMSRESQEATCRSGGGTCQWNNNTCNCQGYRSPYGGSSTGGSNPPGTNCNYTPGQCGSGWYDWGSCSCRTSSSNYVPSGYTPPPSGGYTPPSGYGSCSGGQYWNGSSCVTSPSPSPSTSMSPEEACRQGTNCSWNGSSCQCATTQTSPTPTPTPTPSPSPEPTPAPAPTP